MPIINLDQPGAEEKWNAYKEMHPVAVECCFAEYTPQVERLLQDIRHSGVRIWINSLWASLCAGHDDDVAVEENKPDETWGWILERGATLIQTDRPAALIDYLKSKGRRIP